MWFLELAPDTMRLNDISKIKIKIKKNKKNKKTFS
jgi:hypothetical protein